MAFFKRIQQKINSLWYPQSVTVGKPVTTDPVSYTHLTLPTIA